jgi:hypothetical protein
VPSQNGYRLVDGYKEVAGDMIETENRREVSGGGGISRDNEDICDVRFAIP